MVVITTMYGTISASDQSGTILISLVLLLTIFLAVMVASTSKYTITINHINKTLFILDFSNPIQRTPENLQYVRENIA